jgi:hypothetical protein
VSRWLAESLGSLGQRRCGRHGPTADAGQAARVTGAGAPSGRIVGVRSHLEEASGVDGAESAWRDRRQRHGPDAAAARRTGHADELGGLRRAEEGVRHADRKCGRVEATASSRRAGNEGGHHPTEDGGQHDAWDRRRNGRRALATRRIEAVKRPVERSLDRADDLGGATGAGGQHPMRHESCDERYCEHPDQKETSPDGHGMTIPVDLKNHVRIAGK